MSFEEIGYLSFRALILLEESTVRAIALLRRACCSTEISSHPSSVRLGQWLAMTPAIASLNPGLMSLQPFRAAGLHAGGVKESSPR